MDVKNEVFQDNGIVIWFRLGPGLIKEGDLFCLVILFVYKHFFLSATRNDSGLFFSILNFKLSFRINILLKTSQNQCSKKIKKTTHTQT